MAIVDAIYLTVKLVDFTQGNYENDSLIQNSI